MLRRSDAAALAGVDFTRFLSLDEARKLRVGVIIPTQKVNQYLAAKAAQRQAALGRELTQEEQTALLYEEVLPDLGGDPEVAIKALKAVGIAVVEIPDDTLPAEADTAQPLLPYDFQNSIAKFLLARIRDGSSCYQG